MKKFLFSVLAAASFVANAQKDISVTSLLPVDGYEFDATTDTNLFAFRVTNEGDTPLTTTDTVFFRWHIDSLIIDGSGGLFSQLIRQDDPTTMTQAELAVDSSFVYAFYYSTPFSQNIIDDLTNHVVCYDVRIWNEAGLLEEDNLTNNTSCTAGISSEPIGVDEIENVYSTYPNPVTNVLNIDLTADKGLVTVFDMTGRQVTSAYLSEGTNAVDVAALANGNYMFIITNNDSYLGSGKFQK